VFTAADIPGANDCGPLVHDDPILAGEPGATLRYLGQPVFAVVATTRDAGAPRRGAGQGGDQRPSRCRRC
jgi:xanthine dehydrogenase molybdopterin-binding subunit B